MYVRLKVLCVFFVCIKLCGVLCVCVVERRKGSKEVYSVLRFVVEILYCVVIVVIFAWRWEME